VNYLVVDRWYNKGHDHYHKDEGEGMDMYQVGTSRGLWRHRDWDGQKLSVGRNLQDLEVIANGPIRAIFELAYDAWDASGVKVAEGQAVHRRRPATTSTKSTAPLRSRAEGSHCRDRREQE